MLLMGKSTISMAIFNSFLYVYQRVTAKAGDWLIELWWFLWWHSEQIWIVFGVLSNNGMADPEYLINIEIA